MYLKKCIFGETCNALKNIILAALLSISAISIGQKKFLIDTTGISSCSSHLNLEYAEKFKSFNKNLIYETTAQKGILKDVYTEIQDDFIAKIKKNNFFCSDKTLRYLDRLMTEVLTKNKIDHRTYKILLSRDPQANAYNTGDGTIVINYGLFLLLENEDELVFVISHEIAHQHLNHVGSDIAAFAKLSTSQEMIRKTREIRNQKYGKATKANDLLKNLRYQNYNQRRKKEFEADSVGLALYTKTGRSSKAAVSTLEKLADSDLETVELAVADYKALFEKDGFIIKKKYFDREESLFTTYEADKRIVEDSLKSHPDCENRIIAINKSAPQVKESATVSEAFNEIKAESDLQNLVNLFVQEEYGQSLYGSLKLLHGGRNDDDLRKIIHMNLTRIRRAKETFTINRFVDKVDNLTNTESENLFITFINNIRTADLDLIINQFKT